jgi:hypothetical protein
VYKTTTIARVFYFYDFRCHYAPKLMTVVLIYYIKMNKSLLKKKPRPDKTWRGTFPLASLFQSRSSTQPGPGRCKRTSTPTEPIAFYHGRTLATRVYICPRGIQLDSERLVKQVVDVKFDKNEDVYGKMVGPEKTKCGWSVLCHNNKTVN